MTAGMRTYLLFLFASLPYFHAAAGDYKTDLRKISEAYQKAGSVQMTINYSLYLGSSPVPYETHTGTIVKSGENFLVKQFDTEIVINRKYAVVADHSAKVVMVDFAPKKAERELSAGMNFNVDSLMALLYKSVTELQAKEGQKGYRLVFNEGNEYESIDLFFNTKTYFVEEVQMRYAEPVEADGISGRPRVTITYSGISVSKKSASAFSEKKFLTMRSGKFHLNEQYKEYQFINHVNNHL
jgi:hypothetical protein